MRQLLAKITVLFLIVLLNSCNAVKRVESGQLLLEDNHIYVNKQKVTEDEIEGLITQRPNNKTRLAVYNMAKPNPARYYTAKLDSNLQDMSFFDRMISKKQLTQLADYKINFNNWLMKTGEAPVIIDKEKIEKSAERLKLYYDTKGYFNNQVSYEIDSSDTKEKRAVVNYNLTTGPAYYLDSISTNFESKDLDSIYNRYKRFSRIRPGQKFDFIFFDAEKERLNNI